MRHFPSFSQKRKIFQSFRQNGKQKFNCGSLTLPGKCRLLLFSLKKKRPSFLRLLTLIFRYTFFFFGDNQLDPAIFNLQTPNFGNRENTGKRHIALRLATFNEKISYVYRAFVCVRETQIFSKHFPVISKMENLQMRFHVNLNNRFTSQLCTTANLTSKTPN